MILLWLPAALPAIGWAVDILSRYKYHDVIFPLAVIPSLLYYVIYAIRVSYNDGESNESKCYAGVPRMYPPI